MSVCARGRRDRGKSLSKLKTLGMAKKTVIAVNAALRSGVWASVKAFKASRTLSGRVRESSFPFVSGDTFRALAGTVLDKGMIGEIALGGVTGTSKNIVFAEIGFLEAPDRPREFLKTLRQLNDADQPATVVLHNGDKCPETEFLEELARHTEGVFCLNARDGIKGVTPLPIGLENLTLKRFGFVDDFLLRHDARRSPLRGPMPEERVNLFHLAFSTRTNPQARGHLLELARRTRGLKNQVGSASKNRQSILRSKFILCPPGNGPDTHRVWEAVYLGAVPVILRGTIAPSIVDDLPILQVDDWLEVLEAQDEDLHAIFETQRRADLTKAFFPYWAQRIQSAARD